MYPRKRVPEGSIGYRLGLGGLQGELQGEYKAKGSTQEELEIVSAMILEYL